MSIRNVLLCILVACSITSTAIAVEIGSFPGLRKLIDEADAIVILRIDRNVDTESPESRITFYTTHDCYIYQSLKGNLLTGQTVRLRLLVTQGSLSGTPWALLSTHLIFLTKKRSLDEPTDYRTIEVQGAHIRLSPLGHESMPEGKTLKDKIRSLVSNSMKFSQDEERSQRRFLTRIRGK